MGDSPAPPPLPEMLPPIPERAKPFVREGFRILGEFSDAQQDVLSSASEILTDPLSALREDDLALKLSIEQEEVRPLVSSLRMITSVLSSSEVTAEELLDFLEKEEVIVDESQKNTVLAVAKEIERNRGALRQGIDKSRLGSEILPSLDEFEITVDIRLGFEKEEVTLAVPVALMHLATDVPHEDIWFQMTKSHVERLVEDLQEILLRMNSAEKLAESFSKDS